MKLLENIKAALEESVITAEQALYLVYLHNAMDYPIEPLDLLALTKLKYVVSGKVGPVLLYEENIILKLSGTIKPIYESEVSKKIPARIMAYVAVKSEDGSNDFRFPGSERTIEHTAKNYLKGEGLIAYHYLIFLFMFPAIGEHNRRWENHFNGKFPYKGVQLRIRSEGSATKFKKIVAKKDMGIFLYGTYLFIQASIVENKTFIKTINNYLLEYEEWYAMAADAVKKAKDVESLFTKNKASKEGRLNVAQ